MIGLARVFWAIQVMTGMNGPNGSIGSPMTVTHTYKDSIDYDFQIDYDFMVNCMKILMYVDIFEIFDHVHNF